MEIGRRFCK